MASTNGTVSDTSSGWQVAFGVGAAVGVIATLLLDRQFRGTIRVQLFEHNFNAQPGDSAAVRNARFSIQKGQE